MKRGAASMSPPAGSQSAQSPGPLVWAGILASTCLLLVLFKQVLFLVLPFLLALLCYHLLMGPVHRLMCAGLTRERAALWVSLAFTLLVALGSLWALPWLAGGLERWPSEWGRYLQGGLTLLERTLGSLEQSLPTLRELELADSMREITQTSLGRLVERHLAPLALTVATWAPYLLLAPFVSFYLLREGHRFQRFLAHAVPNAFFERTLMLMQQVDHATRAYLLGMAKLTVLDTLTLALGLWWLGLPEPLLLGLVCAVLAWVPYIGSLAGGLLVVLVTATDAPQSPGLVLWAVGLFVLVRLLDDFVYLPLTIGRSLSMHPLVTVVMIFVGGALAGVVGLMLVLPVLGVVMVVGSTLGAVLTDARLVARWRHARGLRAAVAQRGL
jgi:predicted PurR-regulated permease PerM